ncbi:MAG: NAD(P)H-binding protein [Bacteroidota bacterium]
MKQILITGATGNTGYEVIRSLFNNSPSNRIFAGVRNIDEAKSKFTGFPEIKFTHFDFENPATFKNALTNIDTVFLLRPPHISAVKKNFAPLINKMEEKKVREVLFLSVQGAERSKIIPHNKIERLILDSNLDYIFLRPSYFMQNLTTTLIDDIKGKKQILLPAGKAKFNWIDIANIGEASAILLERFKEFRNSAFDITGYENKNFYEVTEELNRQLPANKKIIYHNVDPMTFFRIKKKEEVPAGKILVLIMLHFLPRFQKEPVISDFYEKLTGKEPFTLAGFLEREKNIFLE